MAEHFTVSTFSSSGTPPVSPRKSSGKSNSTDDFEPLAQLMAVPSSPTDEIMSPCSSRLWNPQRKHSSTKRFYNIHSELTPRPNPAGNLRLILGSSSGNRKMVIEILHWKFLQVFPGIDGKIEYYITLELLSSS